jgi:hypothetical protein
MIQIFFFLHDSQVFPLNPSLQRHLPFELHVPSFLQDNHFSLLQSKSLKKEIKVNFESFQTENYQEIQSSVYPSTK